MTNDARNRARARRQAIARQTRSVGLAEVARLEEEARHSGKPLSISLDEYHRIRAGMTYDECVAVIGSENAMAKGYIGGGNALLNGSAPGNQVLNEAYKWPNPGGYYAEITFHNGRATAKTWKQGPVSGGGRASGSGGS